MKKPILVSILIALSLVSPLSAAKLSGTIVSWTDGDTVRVRLNVGVARVRLIGTDAPEASRGARGDDQAHRLGISQRDLRELAYVATAAARRLAPEGTRVTLETDVQTHDRYGRLLAYLWMPNGLMVNEQLLMRGYAMLLTIPPNVRYVDRFTEAQRIARTQGRGLWGTFAPPQPIRRANCDPAYPTVCIPSPPPDLDCPEIPYRNFTVLSPDPHRFDRDGDGVGCEK